MSQPHLPTSTLAPVLSPSEYHRRQFTNIFDHILLGNFLRRLTMVALGIAGAIVAAPVARAENPAHVQQLLQTNECVNCDLRGSYLSGLDLTGANLVGSQLRGANLAGTNLSRANLSRADLGRTVLTDTQFQGANLNQASLEDAEILDFCGLDSGFFAESGHDVCNTMRLVFNLDTAVCPDETTDTQGSLDELLGDRITEFLEFCSDAFPTYLARSRMAELFGEPSFRGANLTNANLSGMNLSGVNFSHANLSGTTLVNTTLDQTILLHATVDQDQQTNFGKAILSNTDLSQVLGKIMVQEAIARRETDARYTLETINRYQQAHYIEEASFIRNINDVDLALDLSTNLLTGTVDSADYQYAIRYASEDFAIHTAESISGELNNYFGLVYLHTFPGEEGTDIGTLTEICESDEPGTPIPFSIAIPAMDAAMAEISSSCPMGFHNAYSDSEAL